MDIQPLVRDLKIKNESKIVMLIADGLGGLPVAPGGPTELEAAKTPNLDALAKQGVQGSMYPIAPGITPGSGPGHLSLFGYDPVKHLIGRGALEATGVGFKLGPKDMAVRCNFCTLDAQGNISDRRAGRIPTEQSAPLAVELRQAKVHGVEVFVEPVKEHRFVVIFRGEGLGGNVADTDPQQTGVPPLAPVARDDASKRTAEAAARFIAEAKKLLADQPKANGLTMRGFSAAPSIDGYEEVYGLRAAAIAVYPMYKGLAQLVGMEVIGAPGTLEEEIDVLERAWADHDFFFVHFKYTDSRGEDGNFEEKVKMIEQFDAIVPRVMALKPTVLIVTGDHSTPARLASHSWHPVPALLVADTCRPDGLTAFGEHHALRGGLGHFPGVYLMPLALAHAERLAKFGA
ncbi:MAG: 2,3-bisphosphoglycerate-independent phosphoglycerate mutase [Planctomycetes bacterium]|nr:2,3-bisphosphoglycerate-independent phosphoglycerate mutase [Planctomycetota bacterium]MBU4400504.1 2,3-bisphosphoglycerate-independent phosphoglycerate mutase [Planctomycetota bacterium]MCG2684627.1 2,3-bisphosphoglycerate-independent phosphoglycerate mutase [Planctomycetales bacterium]